MKRENFEGKNLKYLRKNNREAILKVLATQGETSRIDLSKLLELSKMTITNIVSELTAQGYITETKVRPDGSVVTSGPKPMLLGIKEGSILAVGIYCSREAIHCSLADIRKGEIACDKVKLSESDTGETFVSNLLQLLQSLLERYQEYADRIIGIGVASVGLVDSNQGVMVSTTEFLNIKELGIKQLLETKFNYPVFVHNEVQAAVLAEQLYGKGKNYRNFIYLSITHGIGTGVVSDGRVLSGSNGYASEAGHMSIERNGKPCVCGNRGCVERYASIPVLLKQAGVSSMEELLECYANQEEKAVRTVGDFIDVLDTALTNLCNIFDPECIVVGHEGALFGPEVYLTIEERVNSHMIQRSVKHVKIQISAFADRAAIRGATAIVFHQLFLGNIKEEILAGVENHADGSSDGI